MTTANTLAAPASRQRTNTTAIFIIGFLFFIFGFITWLNGSLIQFLKLVCQLENDVQAFFVTTAFYMAYFFLAMPSSVILKRTGFKKGMALGLFVMAIGSVIFIPAAKERSFGLFLTGLFIQGTGLALLQTASNPYISIIGPIESAAKRISIMGICNKVAGIISPLILSAVLLSNATELEQKIDATTVPADKEQLLNALAGRVVSPYIILAVLLATLSFCLLKSPLPEPAADKAETTTLPNLTDNKKSIWDFPHLVLGALCIFLYVGVEVMAGDAIGIYGKTMGMPLDVTKKFTSYTLAAMLVGYVVGIFTIPKIISQQMALKVSAILGILFSVAVFVTQGYTAITFIALLGLANALMWPAIWPLAIDKLGKFTKTGSALLVMGIAGGAVLPLLYATLKKETGLNLPNNLAFFICVLPCYLYILYYSIKGYKAERK
ncbi:glucose/galactose MFS transporter [Niastella yeongjuensis]|uniref:Glucose/galactose MFS transporter n=1 Tax=Niastella yeongjuensis TaxID=354355 RepID=A0A1V9DXZ0_9BACT|nr:sugar MFS transporter [Niastella yeongjuensis]OQP38747.1 glucose/galactose MFS transporter [Niastella yeongjuensis]SEO34182.1 glucose/galactose transporter [Niastella yeongjuensis]